MKLNIAYLLLLLVISPNLYGAESSLALQGAHNEFTGQTVKGLTEQIGEWEKKTIPSKWTRKGNSWEEQTVSRNRQRATFVILGSDQKNPNDADVASYTRPLNAYHFIQSKLYGQELLYTPLKDDAEKISLTANSKKIKQFEKTIRSSKSSSSGSHATFAPAKTNDYIFNAKSKKGRLSQLKEQLLALQTTALITPEYDQAMKENALELHKNINRLMQNRIRADIAHELQKSTAALALREKQIIEKNREAEALKASISSFNSPMSNEFVFYMNALIDVYQSENMYHQPKNPDSDEYTIDCIFNAADDEFILNRSELTTKKKDGSEHVVHFGPYMKKDGRLPVEECGTQARKIYKNWYSSIGEPAEATALRTAHSELMAKRQELEKEQLVDKQLFIKDQIEILQESRDDAFVKIRTQLFEAAKLLTSKDLAVYNSIAYNRIRLAFAEGYLADEEIAIASEKKQIADISAAMAAGIDDKGKQEA